MQLKIPTISLGLGRDNKRIFWGMFFNEAAIGVFITLWPLYIADLGASPPQIGLVIGIWGLARLLFLLPSGILMDRVPVRRLILMARFAAILGFATMAVAQQWWHLIPGVLIMSASTVSFPAMSSVIAEEAGRGRARTRAFTIIFTVGPSIALLITPALGGILADQISLRAIVVTAAIFNVFAALVFSLISNREIKVPEGPPASYQEVFAHPGTRTITLLAFGTLFTIVLGTTLVPNFLRDVHDVQLLQIGWLGSAAAVGSILLGIIISRVPVFQQQPLAASALAVGAVAAGLLIFILGQTLWLFALAYMLRGGFLVVFSLMYAALSEIAPDRIRNRAYVAGEFMAGLGFSLAPFAAGWMFNIRPVIPLAASFFILLPIIALTMFLARRMRAEADKSAQLAPGQV
jgi:MFS family permease